MSSDLAPDSLFSCAGQVAIVTGGASGIGLASAEALAAAGARVLIAGLAASDPSAAAAELASRGLEVAGIVGDVTDAPFLASLVDAALARWGRLDTVVANAGAALDDPHAESGIEGLERMFALHVRSVSQLAEIAVPAMASAGGGSFIVMSSIAGLRGNRVLAGYGVTKAANAQLARNLAVRWGDRGIRANAISPGVIATAFARPITDDPAAAPARLARTPLGRFGTPDEVAGAVVWLASRAGAFVSGQNIVIDGGTVISD
ncbi:SDR family NAD(P)-dependent oxidoreductase [Microbacterium rhizomatis]|uniref:SDR family oxidoreductase n=1 Tax=Microbacterium rhizomatis TaxID=1631477 RepID=A0A5J5J0H8_9MICO|nr:SDR family oxidoreductase [Microbacterium rhizomatis]KAA9105056.1 SDR family oxidoreductase [Microbacterium rhizomatis]